MIQRISNIHQSNFKANQIEDDNKKVKSLRDGLIACALAGSVDQYISNKKRLEKIEELDIPNKTKETVKKIFNEKSLGSWKWIVPLGVGIAAISYLARISKNDKK